MSVGTAGRANQSRTTKSKRLLSGLRLAAVVAAAAICSHAEPPRRIISTAPSITEMLYTLGLGDRVAAVTEFCHYPPEVRGKPKIGDFLRPNVETVLSMQPDLVVLLKEQGTLGGRLRGVGLDVFELRHNDLDGIFESLQALGERAGVPAAAARRIVEIRTSLERVRGKSGGLPRRGVMFIVGRTPATIQDLTVVGQGSFLNELIEIAGGRNVFGKAKTFYPRIPREEIYASRPDIIIDMGDMSETDQVTEEHKRSVTELWKQMPSLPAVREGRVYAVADDIFVVPGPRVVEAAQSLFRMIHPEAAP